MSIKVSIIMPSLNVAKYIEECLLSAVNNTLVDKEIICIDAGSTDGTWDILQRYANDPCYNNMIRLIHSDIKSYGYQVNLGIKEAKGEYIAILETDDYVSNDMYEKLYDTAKKYDLDTVKADCVHFYELENGYVDYIPVKLFSDNQELYNKIISTKKIPYLYQYDYSVWKGIYRKEFLLKNRIYFNESLGAAFQDIGFAIQVLSLAEKSMYVDDVFYFYRMDRDGASTYSSKSLINCYNEYKRLLDCMELSDKIGLWNGFYYRMSGSLISSLYVLLVCADYDMNSVVYEKEYKWFFEQLHDKEEFLLFLEKTDKDLFDNLMLVLRDPKEFLQKCIQEHQLRIRPILSVLNKKAYLFGIGNYGRRIIRELYNNRRVFIGITDNNPKKWGEKIYGTTVRSPEKVVQQFLNDNNDKVFVIANKYSNIEIREQLLGLGVKNDYIVDANMLL